MNRKRRKAIKMAKRHKRGIYAPATNPYWQNRHEPVDHAALADAIRRAYNQIAGRSS